MPRRACQYAAILVLGGLLVTPALAAELGDKAPALKIKEWIKGKSVDIESGNGENIFVVEFWATWCGPCRASIPHLTEVQKKYKDQGVVVVGVSDEDSARVKPFVSSQGENMGYVVAIDDAKKTNGAYMAAFGVQGIPHAFIVDKAGNIVWHGHPMDAMDEVLDKVVAGKWDKAAAKQLEEKKKKAMEAQTLAVEYLMLASEADKNTKKMKKLGKKILKSGGDDAQLMNFFAWTVLTDKRIQYRDMKLAMKAAEKAMDASEGKDPAVLDTYARALFDTGNIQDAIKHQKKAIELCADGETKVSLEKTLKEYMEKSPEV